MSGRPRRPVTIVLDTSSSLATHHEALRRAATAALERAWDSSLLPVRPQVGVVATGGSARVVLRHGDVLEPSDLDDLGGAGPADLDGAVRLVADEVERLTSENLRTGATTLAPWLLLVTDGRWGRRDVATTLARLHAPPTPPVVWPVGVGDVDEPTLARVATHGGVVVDTVDDLDAVVPALLRGVLLHPDRVGAPPGSRALEGW